MVTIYLIAYNEELLLPYTIRFYKQRFPGCEIVIYDNFSTDNTREIAREHDCKVLNFYTNDRMSDQALLNIKNSCWKNAATDWVIVCDVDEWLDIHPAYLLSTNATIIRTWFTNMINMKDDWDIAGMDHGVIYKDFPGKWICFNKARIEEMNYDYGAHEAHPIGDIVFSGEEFLLLHYKYINLRYVLQRYREFGKRLSRHNLKLRLGYQYRWSPRKIKKQFYWHQKNARRIETACPPLVF
jgi:glycosyltransferase involved in cell wall biosynthesis